MNFRWQHSGSIVWRMEMRLISRFIYVTTNGCTTWLNIATLSCTYKQQKRPTSLHCLLSSIAFHYIHIISEVAPFASVFHSYWLRSLTMYVTLQIRFNVLSLKCGVSRHWFNYLSCAWLWKKGWRHFSYDKSLCYRQQDSKLVDKNDKLVTSPNRGRLNWRSSTARLTAS